MGSGLRITNDGGLSKMKLSNRTKSNLLSISQMALYLPVVHISKEFFPNWIKQKPGKYECPICRRPYHKEPGPYTYGIAISEKEKKFSLWVQSYGCCKTIQEFPSQSIKEQNINSENIVPILKKVFSFK